MNNNDSKRFSKKSFDFDNLIQKKLDLKKNQSITKISNRKLMNFSTNHSSYQPNLPEARPSFNDIDDILNRECTKNILESSQKEQSMQSTKIKTDVINLNNWELEHFIDNCPKSDKEIVRRSRKIVLNFRKIDKEKLDKLNIEEERSFKDKQLDQGTILLQNIKITTNKFNFDIFLPKHKEKEDKFNKKRLSQINRISNMKNSSFSGENKGLNEKILKDYGIFFSEKENLEILKSPARYREIIKARIRVENKQRNNLINLMEKLKRKKNEKNQVIQKMAEQTNKINLASIIYTQQLDLNTVRLKENDDSFSYYMSKREERAKKMTYDESIADLKTNKRDYEMRKFQIQSEMKEIQIKIDKDLETLNLAKKETKRLLEEKNFELKILKNEINSNLINQKEYYVDIIKKGLDVRNEGLVWAVKRLIELGHILDYNILPNFLDHFQGDYLFRLAFLQFSMTNMKIVLKKIKEKQKKIYSEEDNKKLENDKMNSTSKSSFMMMVNKTDGFRQLPLFSNDTVRTFEDVFAKFDKINKAPFEHLMEELTIKSISEGLSKKIMNKKIDPETYSKFQKFFNEKHNHGFYYEDIIHLRSRIDKIEKEIDEMKNQMIDNFKKKYDSSLLNQDKFRIQYDLMYAALFGNSVSLL